ncbi:hypothetical protein AWM70_03910 [Paenibacillus yonginensis]|uniref:Capsule synthesis protein CapA domain-containing protein n=1 Tax=Paenibacillus yonginensis TaxID=1462996 RepID=A0A1B1MXC0_9BACL|nr:CapA family protein [Paenibacillus yonginensis]ANS73820.1 hypothetical protein AWM70_03910 [Paenibacillus yonginensis]
MYPPRSAKYKQEKKQKQQRQNKVWMIINLTLIVAVCLVGLYIYYSSDNPTSANPDAAAAGDLGLNPSNAGSAGGEGFSSASETGQGSAASNPQHGDSSAGDSASPSVNPEPGTGTATGAGKEDASSADLATAGSSGVQPANSSAGGAVPVNEEPSVVLHFGGDTLFSGKVEAKLEKTGYDYPFQYVSRLFQQDDLTLLNLETPITHGGVGAEDKQYVFKSSPKALNAMAQAGVDAVNLANNHTLDQGVEGLLDTLDHLKNAGIASVGAGADADQAYAPQYFERKGIRIAVFGFSRVLPKADWAAGAGKPGIAGVYDATRAIAAIKQARQQADLVIVIAHWGKERVQQVEDSQTKLARSFVDAGADLVVGGHPHVLQGLEQYKGKWIAYSTGNFIFTRSSNEKTWETAVFEARCSKSGACSMKLIPYTAELGQPVPMNAEDGAKLLQEIQSLSPGVTVDMAGNAAAS